MTDFFEVDDLAVEFPTEEGVVRAADGISFSLPAGARLGIVGESGSGKSTTALALMGLIKPPGRVARGRAVLDGVDLLALSPEQIRRERLRTVSYVPQGAMNSLNPVTRIGKQLREAIDAHAPGTSRREATAMIEQALAGVDLDPSVARRFPHELSGGMKQRVCIATGLILGPKLIIADEPTSALDVVTQRQVMQTLGREQARLGSSLILIGHDMGLMAQFVEFIAVMYAGRLVEFGPTSDLFLTPAHPYTAGLISAVPTLANKGRLRGMAGVTPSLRSLPQGCAFAPRCPMAFARCEGVRPPLEPAGPMRRKACHLKDLPDAASA